MPGVCADGRVGAVDDHGAWLVLELDPGEPIHGRLTSAIGSVHTFHGWLDLARRLETVRGANPSGTTVARVPDPPAIAADRNPDAVVNAGAPETPTRRSRQ
jgi:hypothetical protein